MITVDRVLAKIEIIVISIILAKRSILSDQYARYRAMLNTRSSRGWVLLMKISEKQKSGSVRARRVIGSAPGRRHQRLIEVSQMVIAVIAVSVFFNTGTSAAAQNLCVDPSNTPACSATIQEAVDLAKKSAVITVATGTFHENVVINTGAKPKKVVLLIQGGGVGNTIVDGGGLNTVFNIGSKASVTLSKMTIQNGVNSGSQGLGGGVSSLGTKLTIENCLITNNSVSDGAGGGVGMEVGSLTISNSTLSDNNAFGGGGGLFFATTSAKPTATIIDSTISGNSGNEGAGILIGASSKATIRGSTISGNTAVAVLGSPALGGGIFIDGKALNILDSTISGNVAEGPTSHGGGIDSLTATVTLNNVTIAGNTAAIGGGIDTHVGKSFKSSNSIIAVNTGTTLAPDCDGNLDSTGYNLLFDTTGCSISGKASTDIDGQDPLLQPLFLNLPGTTETQEPQGGSPALKAGNPGSPNGSGGHCLPTDQRGVKRPAGKCDIGAFQLSS
jgi:hypothetical protein